MKKSSKISGFYRLGIAKRLSIIKEFANLSSKDVSLLKHNSALSTKTADMMVENVFSITQMPIGVATNFLINGKNYLIPMAIEETSVIAAASHAAKLARPRGGFTATSDNPLMIGQIQVTGLKSRKLKRAGKKILENKEKIKSIANRQSATVVKLGGGLKDIETKIIKTKLGKMLVIHLIVDVRDAMGANLVNTMTEAVSPYIEELTNGKTRLRIVSNLAVKRLARAKAIWNKDILGEELIDAMLEAYAFAVADPYRCTTHNKGIMNGIDAVAIATGNDFRAIEAGAHSYAAINGKYTSLTKYEKDEEGNLVGRIELPLAVGIVGGITKAHPVAKTAIKILDVGSSQELAEVMASVGLAQNFAALRALAKEGIQCGHMELHANNIAIMAGAKGRGIKRIARKLIKERNISVARARELLHKVIKRKKRK